MAIISQKTYEEKCQNESLIKFAKKYNLARILKQSNIRKAKGVGALTVFIHLMSVRFSGKSLNRLLWENKMCGKKDVYYRFMNSVSANWYKFIRLLSALVIADCIRTYSPEDIPVYILDDTIHKRNRSNEVELLTRVRDHNDGRYYRGFRCLTLGYHNTRHFLPIDFRLLSSAKEKTRINGMKPGIDKRTTGYKAREFAVKNSYQAAFDMIDHAPGAARYVLFDSWFSEPIMFKNLRKRNLHGIGMLKAKKGSLYRYKGKYYNLEALYSKVNQFLHQKDDYAAIGVELRDGTPFSITFVRDKNNKRDWLAIGTTDLSLSPRQVIELYSRRWNIEVFFKTIKSLLGFAKECQARSFDAVICSIAVVFTRYIVLSWANMGLPEPLSPTQLFFSFFDEFHKPSFADALDTVIAEFAVSLSIPNFSLDISVRHFMLSLPHHFHPLLSFLSCET